MGFYSNAARTHKCVSASAIAFCLTFGAATSAHAQVNEIIVTAQKREQSAQEVPIAVSVLQAGDLADQGVVDIFDLGDVVPSIQVGRTVANTNFFIRGIGSQLLGLGVDGSVAIHSDGAYIARSRATLAGLYDLERVEVLRGPQGTLYGRNATGGAVNLITKKPTDQFEGYMQLSAGNYGRINGDGAISGPVIKDRINGRLSFISLNRDGFGTNVYNGSDIDDQSEWGVRAQADIFLTDRLTFQVSADHYEADDSAFAFHMFGSALEGTLPAGRTGLLAVDLLGATPVSSIRDIDSTVPQNRKLRISGVTTTIDWEIGDDWSVKSITAFRDSLSDTQTDVSGGVPANSPGPLIDMRQVEDANWFSQELQLLYQGDRATVLAGVYAFDEHIDARNNLNFPVLPLLHGLGIIPVPFPADTKALQTGTADTKAYAAFANIDYKISDSLTGILGLRYSYEERSRDSSLTSPTPFAPQVAQIVDIADWDAFTPKFVLDYAFAGSSHAYASVSRGFKSGVAIIGDPSDVVDPEYVWAYEVGLKSRLLDGLASFNLAAFYYDYTDMQISRVVNNLTFTENIAASTIKGAEFDANVYLSDTINLTLSGAYIDSKIDQIELAPGASLIDPVRASEGDQSAAVVGNKIPYAPEFSFNFGIEKEFLLRSGQAISLRGNLSYKDGVYFDIFNQDYNAGGSLMEVGLRGSWLSANERIRVSLWVKNLTNETEIISGIVQSATTGFPRYGALNEPRTFGVDFKVSM